MGTREGRGGPRLLQGRVVEASRPGVLCYTVSSRARAGGDYVVGLGAGREGVPLGRPLRRA